MKQYIGTKIVHARPACRVDMIKPDCVIKDQTVLHGEIELAIKNGWEIRNKREGYEVVYEDGYNSWSPKEVFEGAYRRTDGLNFGLALEACKMGKKIARAGWNEKGQYVELGRNFRYDTCDGKEQWTFHEDIDGMSLVFVGTRGTQVGWLASQADMLADDWHIVGRSSLSGWKPDKYIAKPPTQVGGFLSG